MPFPPRLGHLATRAVLTAKLGPTYAQAHNIDEEEAASVSPAPSTGRCASSCWPRPGCDARRQGAAHRGRPSGEGRRPLGERPSAPGASRRTRPGAPSGARGPGGGHRERRRAPGDGDGRGRRAADKGLAEAAGFLAKKLLRAPPKAATCAPMHLTLRVLRAIHEVPQRRLGRAGGRRGLARSSSGRWLAALEDERQRPARARAGTPPPDAVARQPARGRRARRTSRTTATASSSSTGSWATAAERAGVRYYPKLVLAAPFTPATGRRVLVAPGEDRARSREAELYAAALE